MVILYLEYEISTLTNQFHMLIFKRALLFVFLLSMSFMNHVIGQEFNESAVKSIDQAIQIAASQDKITFKSDLPNGTYSIDMNGEMQNLSFINGMATLDFETDRKGSLQMLNYTINGEKKMQLLHISANKDETKRVKIIPLWMSLLPPLIAIILALIFKEVIISLFIGIWSGAFIAGGLKFGSLYYFMISLMEVVQKYIVNALADSGHLSVIIFSLLIGGMVAIISKNGGMAGVVKALSKYAKGRRSTQFITWLLGIAIFFDDYANTLIVGNTMRAMTDKFKISREKLAYIVDSTAAPVAAIAFITTWIGAELGYIDGAIQQIENFPLETTPYGMFLSSLKYSFYPILTLIFILILIRSGKDYGPMLKAEKRAIQTGQVSPAKTKNDDEPDMEDLSPVAGAPLKWYNAVIPIAIVILMTLFGLVDTGMASIYDSLVSTGYSGNSNWGSVWSAMGGMGESQSFFQKLGNLIGSSDSYVALLWASLSGVIAAIALTVGGKIIKLFDTMHYMTVGFKTMMPALIILTLAWALAITTQELYTANYITGMLEGNVNPRFMPAIIFVLSAFIAFSTGSSWSTMAILFPIAIPATWALSIGAGLDHATSYEILLNAIATVLAASVLGDHVSPISDTTILSSLASDCNHIDHVRTQLPYAMTVGVAALLCVIISGFFPLGWIFNWALLLLFVIAFYFIINKVGKLPTH